MRMAARGLTKPKVGRGVFVERKSDFEYVDDEIECECDLDEAQDRTVFGMAREEENDFSIFRNQREA